MSNLTDTRGFTLIEVLVAISILTIGMIGVAGLAGTAWRALNLGQEMSQAVNLAQDRIEALQMVPFENLELTDVVCIGPAGPPNRPQYTCTPASAVVPLGNRQYTWSYTVTHIDLDANGIASPIRDGFKRVDVTVTWPSGPLGTLNSTTLTTMRFKG